MAAEGLVIVYDGECPFCSAYVKMLRLREAAGPVTLVSARSDDPRVGELKAAGYDLDAGMVVLHRGEVLHGDRAMTLLSVLSRPNGPLSAAMKFAFRSRRAAAVLYPVLGLGRRATLAALGRRRIADGASPG